MDQQSLGFGVGVGFACKGHEGALQDDETILYLDCGGDFTSVCICLSLLVRTFKKGDFYYV